MVEIAGGAVDKICRSIGTNELKLTIHLAELLDLLHLELSKWKYLVDLHCKWADNISRVRLI
jgi:hypothetical protein